MRWDLRIMDVNINRLCEACRLLEDVARFIIEDEALTLRLKSLRHQARRIIKDRALVHRDSEGDLGRNIHTESELCRSGLGDLVSASFKRIEEALRVLEEMSKMWSGEMAVDIKAFRFEVYGLESLFIKKVHPFLRRKIALPLLYLVLSIEHCTSFDPVEIARRALFAGVGAVQLRSKVLDDRQILALGRELKQLCAGSGALFIVNDRPDIALSLSADGLHLGQRDLEPSEARKIVGKEMIIGLSCHTTEQLSAAQSEVIDYTAIGPIFSTKTKTNPGPVTGPRILQDVECYKLPIVAIGGITPLNLKEIVQRGCRRVAVATGITTAENVEAGTKEYLEGL